ncbi:hypothetical protein [Chitinophaga arvensicola]|uniref:Uncharacterized protein n=1 Tax=Chitinophaga arvensicola TaxID=29529 RepID=A0A1I0S8Y9_9BACT|nr:hypothetical protein [Chitinophaga arvensicola]SEW52606.1 hypothetical protein SAMN04488122_4969 [Chitinophaga arvensicola]
MKSVVNYFNLVGEFTNPAKFMWGAFLSGLIAFIVAVILVIVLRKFILVPRSSKILRFVAYTYFVLLPLLAGFFAFKWGFFNSLRKDIKAHQEVYAKHIPSVFDQQASAAVQSLFRDPDGRPSALTKMTTNQVVDTVGALVYNVYGSTLEQHASQSGARGQLAAFMLRTTKGAGIAALMKKYIAAFLSDKLKLGEGTSEALMETKLISIIQGGLFLNIAVIQVDLFLKGLQKGVLITFLLILAIPLAEIAIAHYLHRKKLKAVPIPVKI